MRSQNGAKEIRKEDRDSVRDWKKIVLRWSSSLPPSSVMLLLSGLVLFAGIMWVLYPSIGENLWMEVFGVIVTVVLIDSIIKNERKKKWKKYNEQVKRYISVELASLFSDIVNLLHLFPAASGEVGVSDEELFRMGREAKLKELKKLAESDVEKLMERLVYILSDIKQISMNHDLFSIRTSNIKEIEMLYSDLIDPDNLLLLMVLKTKLVSLTMHLKILNNAVLRGEVKASGIGVALNKYVLASSGERISYRMHDIIKIIIKMLDVGMFDLHEEH